MNLGVQYGYPIGPLLGCCADNSRISILLFETEYSIKRFHKYGYPQCSEH